MPKTELGPVGAVLGPDAPNLLEAAATVEQLGIPTVWLPGGPLAGLHQVADVVRATKTVRVATGIIAVDRFGADEVVALYRDLEAEHPGRFVVGLGGAHGGKPFATLGAYLDRLDAAGVPASARVLAALGPRMLDLARERAAGAFPVLVTPEYTAEARSRLGGETTLAVDQLAVLDPDPDRARTTARGPLGFLGTLPQYKASFARMGFTEAEIDGQADRLVDALVPSGDVERLAAHVAAQRTAGADHVAVNLVADGPQIPVEAWRRLAPNLLGA